MATVALRGKLEQVSEDGQQWMWKGVWAFGPSISVAATPSQKQPQQPFEYKWQMEKKPFEIVVPSAPIPEVSVDTEPTTTDVPPAENTTELSSSSAAPAQGTAIEGNEEGKEKETEEKGPNINKKPSDGGVEGAPNEEVAASSDTKKETHTEIDGDASSKDKGSAGFMTYAVVPEGHPPFTEATNHYPDKKCPVSGQWKGYFQNVTGRKKDQTQKIQEEFYLFLNATPCPSNKFFFFDETPLPPTVANSKCLVLVRGMGENPFGTFELTGYFDLESNILEIQRQYVVVGGGGGNAVDDPKPSNRRASGSSPRNRGSPVMTRHKSSRPYFTRKRQPSWKRKQDDSESNDPSPVRKKNKRPSKIGPDSSLSPAAVVATAAATAGNVIYSASSVAMSSTTTTPTVAASGATASGLVVGAPPLSVPLSSTATSNAAGVPAVAGEAKSLPTATTTEMPAIASTTTSSASVVMQPASIPPSLPTTCASTVATGTVPPPTTTISAKPTTPKPPNKRPASRKRSSAPATSSNVPKSSSSSPSSVTSSLSPYLKLPQIGDPKRARWRAAHFLYYQRQDPEELNVTNSNNNCSNPNNSSSNNNNMNNNTNNTKSGAAAAAAANPRYVVYEGEMVDSKREGRGICLYSNGMLYEGEWKRNKEHGRGKLMTADRRRIYYEGEFERGRMQGQGTYYYSQAENSIDETSSDNIGSRYIGEFKENMRNGYGIYYLPDDSVYNGLWNQGVPNGRGIFTWPDSSVYDGDWKDGKRHGQGLLKTSDGFIYDGMWANNAMEGRGAAVYPNGSKYEGQFSNGRREGRGTMHFINGAVYEGRFRDDAVDGQGTMKMSKSITVPADSASSEDKDDFMIPISFQSDMTHIHTKAGFTAVGD